MHLAIRTQRVFLLVSLELAIVETCSRNGIVRSKLNNMNVELAKASIYNLAKQNQITAWEEFYRNKAAHGQFSEYNSADVDDLIKVLKDF